MNEVRHFRCLAHVQLDRPVPWQSSLAEQRVVAYYRMYIVCAASPEQARSLIEADIRDGVLDADQWTVEEVRFEDLPPKAAKRCRHRPPGRFWRTPPESGICYRGGRGFHA